MTTMVAVGDLNAITRAAHDLAYLQLDAQLASSALLVRS